MRCAAFSAVAIAGMLASSALAQENLAPSDCIAPTPPEKVSISPPVKPKLPSCMDEKTLVSRCSDAVTDRFNAQVDAYNVALEKSGRAFSAYQTALHQYLDGATQYANCEIDKINRKIE